MDNEKRLTLGLMAIMAGTADYDQEDATANVTDTLANILHYCREQGIEIRDCLAMAELHVDMEMSEVV